MDGFFSRFVTASKPPPPSFFSRVFDSVNSFPGDIKSILTIAIAILISLHIFLAKIVQKFIEEVYRSRDIRRKMATKPRFVKPKRFTKESEEFGEEYAGDMSSDDEEGDNNRVVVGPKEIPSVVKEMKEKSETTRKRSNREKNRTIDAVETNVERKRRSDMRRSILRHGAASIGGLHLRRCSYRYAFDRAKFEKLSQMESEV